MTQRHPITPPEELVEEWGRNVLLDYSDTHWGYEQILCAMAARWGADQELAACCEWLRKDDDAYQLVGLRAVYLDHELHAARRPKPPSLKEQALGALSRADKNALTNPLTGEVVALRAILSKEQSDTIRRALNELPDN